MSAAAGRPVLPAVDVEGRLSAVDWTSIGEDLDARGAATIEGLLEPRACAEMAALYENEDDAFRSRVVMARHNFGRGEYK